MTLLTIFKKKDVEEKKPRAFSKGKLATLIGGALLMMNPASAAEVNWSEITAVIDGFVGIVPSFAAMISAVMPILLVIALYTFIIKFWDKILHAIDSAFSGFR
jgi:hypothetical protein